MGDVQNNMKKSVTRGYCSMFDLAVRDHLTLYSLFSPRKYLKKNLGSLGI